MSPPELCALLRSVTLVDLDPSIATADLEAQAHPMERRSAASLPERRRRTYLGGRVAARRALVAAGGEADGPVVADEHGAPVPPPGFALSIAHKDEAAVALAVRAEGGLTVGVDVEQVRTLGPAVAARVLTEAERATLGADLGARALERFAAKEAIYKAIHPRLMRYVAFHEVELEGGAEGDLVARGRVLDGLVVAARVGRLTGPRGAPLIVAVATSIGRCSPSLADGTAPARIR